MPKKILKKQYPSLALAFVAVLAPLIAVAAPTFAAEVTTTHTIFDTTLFNAVQFRSERRKAHPAQPVDIPRGKPGSQTSSFARSEASSVSSSASSSLSLSSSAHVLIFEDLTGSQRETLRQQLRIRACPQYADAAYKQLCESMLKALPPLQSRTGLTNGN